MVLVFSSRANLSGHIPKEIERAVSQGVTVMPLRIEDVAAGQSRWIILSAAFIGLTR